MEFISDVSGVKELIISIIGFLIYPWAQFNFQIKALEKLYLVNTKDTSLIN